MKKDTDRTPFQQMLGQAIYFEGGKTNLSKRLGCSRTTIDNWLSGRTSPPCAKLAEIAKITFPRSVHPRPKHALHKENG
jgi:transcriptional regulator with XRE-family HTH domain